MPESNILRIETHKVIFEIPLDKHIIIVQGDTLEGEDFLFKLLDWGYNLAKYSKDWKLFSLGRADMLEGFLEQRRFKFDLFYISTEVISWAWFSGELDELVKTIDENTERYFVLRTRNSHLHFKNQSEVGYYIFDVDASGEKDIIRLKLVENQYTIRGYLDDLRFAYGVK